MKILPAGWLTRNDRIAWTDSASSGSPSARTASGAPPSGRPGAALDQRVGAARAHLRREGRPGVGGDVPGRHRLDARRPPERLLGDVDAGAVVGGQEDEARRVGRGLGAQALEHLDAALHRRRQAAADFRRRRSDQDEFPRRDRAAVVHQALLLERVLGGRRVDEGGVDLAVARRLEHRQGRPGNEQHGDAGIGAEGALEAARQARFGQGAVDAEAHRAAPLGRLLRARAAGERRRRQGSGDEEAAARHPPHYCGRRPRSPGRGVAGTAGRKGLDPGATLASPPEQARRRALRHRPTSRDPPAAAIRPGQAPRSPLSRSPGRAAIARIHFASSLS